MARETSFLSAEDRLRGLSTTVLMCRHLRHSWPKTEEEIRRYVKMEPKVYGSKGRVVEAVRRMQCIAGCGVERIETVRRNRHGILEREGRPKLVYPDGYLLPKLSPGVEAEVVGAYDVTSMVLGRMFQDLDWN